MYISLASDPYRYLQRQEGGSRASRSRGRRPLRVALTLTRPADLSLSPLNTPFSWVSPTLYYHVPTRTRSLSETGVHGSAIFAGPFDTDIHRPSTFSGIICTIEVIPPCFARTKLPLPLKPPGFNLSSSAESENILYDCHDNNDI